MEDITYGFVCQLYNKVYGENFDGRAVVLFNKDSYVVGHVQENGNYHPNKWLRVYTNGRAEKGILWGGDVWEPSSEVKID